MPSLLSRYATPFITGLFIVSLVSGTALFFHVGGGTFHGMHEWLSMVLILSFVLHVWKNWRPFANYLKRLPMAVALGLSLVASLAFAWPSLTGTAQPRTNPQSAMIRLVTSATAAEIAPLYSQTEEAFLVMLRDKGFRAAATGQSLAEIASASGKTERDLVTTLATLQE
jgi:hypothetical protein